MLGVALLLLGGCGGSSGRSTATSGSPAGAGSYASQTASSKQLQQFAQCMRSHGLGNFPDPTGNGQFFVPTSVLRSAQYNSALQACRSLAPPAFGGGSGPSIQQQNQALKFAQCMRSHGVPKFPDPTFSGGQAHLPQTVDLKSPQVQPALEACRALLPVGLHHGGS
jgi:hypothetical protein